MYRASNEAAHLLEVEHSDVQAWKAQVANIRGPCLSFLMMRTCSIVWLIGESCGLVRDSQVSHRKAIGPPTLTGVCGKTCIMATVCGAQLCPGNEDLNLG